jgi:elongation factor 1-gamma
MMVLEILRSWIDFSAHELELPATVWFYPVIGYMPYNAAAVTKAKADLAKGLASLEKHLLDKVICQLTYCICSITCCSACIC